MAEVRVLALNAPAGVKESDRVGLVHVGSEIPVAPGSVLGVALDAWFPAEARRISDESGASRREDRGASGNPRSRRAVSAGPRRDLLGGAEGAGSRQTIACESVIPERSASS